MKLRLALGVLVAAAVVAPSSVVGTASARPSPTATHPSPPTADRPLFAVLRGPGAHATASSSALPTWTFSYQHGSKYNDSFVGADPTGGTSTTVPVYIVPIRLVLGTFVADPLQVLPNGKTVVQNTIHSPVFQGGIDFVQGGTDVGNTQYIDAYQRASLWGTVSSHTNYHVLLGQPTVEPEQSFTVPKNRGKVKASFGTKVIEANIDWFDNNVQPLLSSLHIPSNALPIFVTTQTYLLQHNKSGCCIGGYHSYNGTWAYSHFSYIQNTGVFSQDVSALSHEVGEFIDDPFTNNNSPCGSFENGDPLEATANNGDYPYTLGGFTYHLQDLATPVYFGAPASTTVNGWTTFQGTPLAVCQNGS